MAAEKTIVARFNTPVDDTTGERTRILIQTTPDNVIDPDTGKTLTETLVENTYSDATTSTSGLMSPQSLTNLNNLMNERTVVSDTDPNMPCMWFEIESIE